MSYYIVIEGVIGVGKTTLARYLQEALNTNLVIEVFEENPFLANFYQDRSRYAFQTQVFFLLSRYHQQKRLNKLARPIVSDYLFAKDHLFAQQNLQDDEFATYEQVYEALSENVSKPDLVVYLRADTPVLMSRIAMRDRPYERNMDINYIDGLRIAYDNFFADYTATPFLTIDSNTFDFVSREEDRLTIINQIRGVLGVGPRQGILPGLDTVVSTPMTATIPTKQDQSLISRLADKTVSTLRRGERRLADFQEFHREFDRTRNFSQDLLLNFVLMQEEVGELASVIAKRWKHDQETQSTEIASAVRDELADILAYLLKIANYTGVDLEAAYLEKMARNEKRVWT